jgi:hypothetical protein
MMINKVIDELESELSSLGRPIATDPGVRKFVKPDLVRLYPMYSHDST